MFHCKSSESVQFADWPDVSEVRTTKVNTRRRCCAPDYWTWTWRICNHVTTSCLYRPLYIYSTLPHPRIQSIQGSRKILAQAYSICTVKKVFWSSFGTTPRPAPPQWCGCFCPHPSAITVVTPAQTNRKGENEPVQFKRTKHCRYENTLRETTIASTYVGRVMRPFPVTKMTLMWKTIMSATILPSSGRNRKFPHFSDSTALL